MVKLLEVGIEALVTFGCLDSCRRSGFRWVGVVLDCELLQLHCGSGAC